MTEQITKALEWIRDAKIILIGAGAGFSTAAGYTYSGERFKKYFADFEEKFGFTDMYSGGFYPFPTDGEFWAYWSRNILCNRYDQPANKLAEKLLQIVQDKDYFVLTTNVDHLFQSNGFDKKKLFYTQGDYGLFQCPTPCHNQTYDNEQQVRKMHAHEVNMSVPEKYFPRCPKCGKIMTMNLRADDTFVEDNGWRVAAYNYEKFLHKNENSKILYLELGVGSNTPGIIKYPFWRFTLQNPNAKYICINKGQAYFPQEIGERGVALNFDIAEILNQF